MPTYEYECEACGYRFEKFQSITARPLRKCPECEQRKLQRLIGTGGGVLFKGSGFYETDYRSESYKKAAAADKPAGDKDSKTSGQGSQNASAGKSSKPGGDASSSRKAG